MRTRAPVTTVAWTRCVVTAGAVAARCPGRTKATAASCARCGRSVARPVSSARTTRPRAARSSSTTAIPRRAQPSRPMPTIDGRIGSNHPDIWSIVSSPARAGVRVMGNVDQKVRARFWVEASLAALTGALFVLTLFWHDWLEAFGFDPDNHNGTVEWLIVAGLFVLCVVFSFSARLELAPRGDRL